MDNSNASAISTFVTVTGADRDTAERLLEAHGWDLDRGVEYYIEHGDIVNLPLSNGGGEEARPDRDARQTDAGGSRDAAGAEAYEQPYDLDGEDAELQEVLAMSLRGAGPGQRNHQGSNVYNGFSDEVVIDSDSDNERPTSNDNRSNNNNRDDIEELQTLAQHRIHRQPRSEDMEEFPRVQWGTVAGTSRPPNVRSRSFGQGRMLPPWAGGMDESDSDHGREGSGFPIGEFFPVPPRRQAVPPRVLRNLPDRGPEPLRPRRAVPEHELEDSDLDSNNTTPRGRDEEDMDLTDDLGDGGPPRPSAVRARGVFYGGAPGVGGVEGFEDLDPDHIDLPDGVDLEEARMMEALMFGTPYQGRLAHFPPPPQPSSQPLSPTVAAQRLVREEQDAAYQASLLADMEKQEVARMAEERAALDRREEEERRQLAEVVAAAEQAAYEEEIAMKASRLPKEPAQGAPDAVNFMIRFPDGRRVSRRFSKSNNVGSLFDFVDVEAKPDIRPGTYNLVTQFPRRVFSRDQAGTLESAGLNQRQEAVFIELL